MAMLSRAVQEAITEEIADVFSNVSKGPHTSIRAIGLTAELIVRNLYYRDLIDKEAAVKVFEATGGAMGDIERWGPLKKLPVRMDSFMREDIRERARSLGVVTTLPEFTMAWEDPVLGLKISSHTNPEHAMNLLGIIEAKQEEEEKERRRPDETFQCSKCKVDWHKKCITTCPECGKTFCKNCWNEKGGGEEGCHRHAFGVC